MAKATQGVVRKERVHQLDMATQPIKRLRMMLQGGEDILEVYRVLNRTEDNVVGELLRHQGKFYEWDHYPKGDVYDKITHSQFFYHAHPSGLRDMEHGHFHTFIRAKGMPKGMRPIKHASNKEWPKGDAALSHIVGISMDPRGIPLRLFSTNRWVTGEAWYKASDVNKLIGKFVIEHAQPSWPTNRWISGMIRLFWPQITMLLKARDTAVAAWAAENPKVDVFEDRSLELTSQAEISVEAQINAVRAAIEQKEAAKASN